MKIEIKTMGCRLNRAEAAAMTGALEAAGYEVEEKIPSISNHPSDIITQTSAISHQTSLFLLHTCTVTGAARNEALRLIRGAKRRGAAFVIVSGCGAGTERDAFFEAGADVLIDKKNGEIIGDDFYGIGRLLLSALRIDADSGAVRTLPRFASTRASVKIQDGCDFRCAYCIVPDARGAPVSRPAAAVLDEIRRLAETEGFREFVLAGVNVATWTHGGLGLCDLIARIAEIGAVSRIRLSSVEPATTERALIDMMADVAQSKLCRTLHYPLQSADDGVLRLMRRRYTVARYAEVLDYAAEKIPRLGLGADIIAGFPGESDAAFERTREFVLRRQFTNLHVFPYSERPGTPAASMPDKIPVQTRRERARELLAIGAEKARRFAESFIGNEAEMLVEKVGEDGVGQGWTSEYVSARVAGLTREDCGKTLRFKVNATDDATVTGTDFTILL